MRKMIVAAAVLAVSSAQAAEQLKFGDVNFFPKAGQVNLAVDLSSTYEKQRANSESLETRGYLAETRLQYSLTDTMNFGLLLDYAYDRETENRTVGTDGNWNTDGLANPGFYLNHRYMDQKDGGMNFDVGLVGRVNIEDAETGDAAGQNTEDGNFANGRNSLEVNTKLGHKWNEANEWQFAGGLVYNFEGETDVNTAGAGSTTLDLDDSFDIYARATYQYRPVNEFMMLLSAQATRVGQIDGELQSTPSQDTKSEDHIDIDFRFTAKYLVTDSTIVKFNYGMSNNSNIDQTVGTTDASIKRRRENFYGLGVEFLF